LKYCNHLADLTGVRDITRFNSDVSTLRPSTAGTRIYLFTEHVEWDDKEEKWILTIKDNKTGEEFKDEAPIIVNASGILSQPKMPDLPGMKDFNGRVLHTARYDTEIDLKGKRVALVGAGSTSIQVLPQIQKVAAKVDCYIRSSTWVIPMFAADVRDKYFGFDSSDGFSADTADRINPYYTDEDRKQWKEKPETLYQHRKDVRGLDARGASLTFTIRS
jgi:cation diffusion facilitator CzcD-associated flavoprotein CzcO